MTTIEEISFEQALAELEEIVQKLEGGTLALEETMTLYQRGRNLAAHCQHLLDEVELRVQQLVPDGDEGYSVAPFDAET
jgi:exodeoxyribonuclease VII small subunit